MKNIYTDFPLWTRIAMLVIVSVTTLFLVLPLVAIVPLSFSNEPWFSYPLPGLSLRWYRELIGSDEWRLAILHSLLVAVGTTVLSTTLGTLAALSLARARSASAQWLTLLFVSPMIVPAVVSALGTYLFFSSVGLTNTFVGLIVAHSILATPFVVITLVSSFKRFDFGLLRAAASLGASRTFAFRTVMLPVIAPGMLAAAILAFATSFDEIVVALFITGPAQRTLPIQMFAGIREDIQPTIIAASVVVMGFTGCLLALTGWLKHRAERMLTRG